MPMTDDQLADAIDRAELDSPEWCRLMRIAASRLERRKWSPKNEIGKMFTPLFRAVADGRHDDAFRLATTSTMR